MKTVTEAHITKLEIPFAGKYKPKPFPGKCPTRIFIHAASIGTGRTLFFKYEGKPSKRIALRWMAWFDGQQQAGRLMKYTVLEYDREHGLYRVWGDPTQPRRVEEFCESLWTFYHPDFFANSIFSWTHYRWTVDAKHRYRMS